MADESIGNVIISNCENTHVINELNIPMITLGVKNLAIAATPDGILIAEKKKSDGLKDYIDDQPAMCGEARWGEYRVLDLDLQSDNIGSLTRRLIIKQGQQVIFRLQYNYSELFTVVKGTGKFIHYDGDRKVTIGDSFSARKGMQFEIAADSELHIITVKYGYELFKDDIEGRSRHDFENMGSDE